MAEYIEREALAADLRGSYEELRNIYNDLRFDEERRICSAELNSFMECIIRVKNAPAADVAEVVRCKDCVHHTEDIINAAVLWCEKSGLAHLRDYYCADGKGEGE